ncbi:MAG: hypothetical protein BJ554DRAFT_1230, partial [Olpidium bornovanus]
GAGTAAAAASASRSNGEILCPLEREAAVNTAREGDPPVGVADRDVAGCGNSPTHIVVTGDGIASRCPPTAPRRWPVTNRGAYCRGQQSPKGLTPLRSPSARPHPVPHPP